MADLATLDILLRGACLGVLLLCALVFGVGARGRKGASVVLLCLSLIPYLIVSAPGIDPGAMRGAMILFASFTPVLVYWAAVELFQDDVVLRPWQMLLAGGVVAAAALSHLAPVFGVLRGVFVLILFAHVLWVVMSGAADDLVDARRRFRRWFLIWVVVLGVVITGLEVAQLDRALPMWVYALQAAVILSSVGAFLAWAVRMRADIWVAPPQTPPSDATPARTALAQRAEAAMAAGLWREEGLTVAEVAARLNTREHRLRSAINQGLGHRNFASFVNAYRIEEAQRLLSDPEAAERTILSIAYDVGFSSLGPFNRAFRARTGLTPSAYRQAAASRGD